MPNVWHWALGIIELMRMPRDVLDTIAAHARRESPRECCGLLIGTATDVVDAVPAGNVADDPHRRYEVSPVDHFAQIRRCREQNLQVVGVYHSHPHSAPAPSPTDLELAFEEFLYIIAGPVDGGAPIEIRGYRFTHGRFAPEDLIAT